ncbi:MAG: (2Fe-2S)-binding protein [Deltaproteobacteria bacterium HGW-Deltaproteobacteria-15]|jgi:carbon-monoxide dehydrogenase small subunit|nr:MAG: (2Fe-2S)-binding protein [Deltaproteobacteria bacterium HGW-Deltaproteobacteria-15]
MDKKSKRLITLTVNGQEYELATYPNRTLLEVLREDLSLKGAKEACEDGVCGACTVLLDGKPVRSCLLLAVEAQGGEITTIEGLSGGEKPHPIQQAFLDHGAVQCGYCTSGMVLTAKALLDANPRPSEKEVLTAISGNFCRCTGYNKIVKAISSVKTDREGGH